MQSISFYRWQFDKYVLILINIVWQNFITRRDFQLRHALGCFLLAFCYYFLSILISMYNVLQLCCLPISSCCYFCCRLCQWWHKTNTQETSWRGKKIWRRRKREREGKTGNWNHINTLWKFFPQVASKCCRKVQTFATMRRLWMVRCEAGRQCGRLGGRQAGVPTLW